MYKNFQKLLGRLKSRQNIFWILIFSFILTFSLLVPLDGDDFTFLAYGRSINDIGDYFDALKQTYSNLNGRLMGNGLQLALVGVPLLSALVRAIVMTLIPYIVVKIVSPRTKYMRNLTVMMTLLIPAHIFSQTYAWQAGFYNYVTSALGLLVVLYIMQQIYIKGNYFRAKKVTSLLSILTLTIVTSLFAENVTIALLVVTLCAMVYGLYSKKSKYILPSLALFIGSIIGAVIMFSSPAYSVIAGGTDEYRDISLSVEGSAVEIYSDKLYRLSMGLIGLESVLMLMLGLFIIVYSIVRIEMYRKDTISWISIAAPAVAILYPLLIFIQTSGEFAHQTSGRLSSLIKLVTVIMSAFFVFAVYRYGALCVKEKTKRLEALLLLLLAGILLAPFIIIEPFGGRNFLLPYILVVTMVLLLLNSFTLCKNIFANKVSAALLGLVGLMFIAMFSTIKLYDHRNQLKIEGALNASEQTVKLTRLPFHEWTRDNNDPVKVQDYINKCECPYGIQCSKTCVSGLQIKY